MSRPGGGFNRIAVQWAFLVALGIVAVAYFLMPARAAERPAWSAELWAMEEGEMLVAAVYSAPPDDDVVTPAIAILCGDPLWLRYDPGPLEDEGADWTGRTAVFEFAFGDRRIRRELSYEAMDGNWTTRLVAGDELLAAIESGSEVDVAMADGGLPRNAFSLSGSSAAIREVRSTCR